MQTNYWRKIYFCITTILSLLTCNVYASTDKLAISKAVEAFIIHNNIDKNIKNLYNEKVDKDTRKNIENGGMILKILTDKKVTLEWKF